MDSILDWKREQQRNLMDSIFDWKREQQRNLMETIASSILFATNY